MYTGFYTLFSFCCLFFFITGFEINITRKIAQNNIKPFWRELRQVWDSNVIFEGDSNTNSVLNSACQRQVYSMSAQVLDGLFINNKSSFDAYASVQVLTRVTHNQSQSQANFIYKCPHVLHFSFHCANALIFLEQNQNYSDNQSETDYKIKTVKNLWNFLFKSGSPRFTHHIFVGKKNQLDFLSEGKDTVNFDLKPKVGQSDENSTDWNLQLVSFVKDLKYKTGISVDDFNSGKEQNVHLIFNPDFVQALGFSDAPNDNFPWDKFTTLKFRLNNVRNGHLRVDGYPMALHIVRDEKGRPYAGTTFKTFEALSRHHNFTYTFTFNHFRNLGRNPQNPEKWDGFIGALQSDLIDLAFYMSNTEERYLYASFSTPLIFQDLVFFTALPEVSVKWQAIVYPFEPSVWFLVLLSVAATAPIFYAQFKFKSPKSQKQSKSDTKLMSNFESDSPFYTALILPICALLMESFPAPKNRRIRPLLALFFFYAIIISVFYNSNLISFLTFPEDEKYPRSFLDLTQMTQYHSTLQHYPGSPCDVFFNRTTNPTFLEIKKRFKRERSSAKCLISAALEKKPFPSVCFGWDLLLGFQIAKNLTVFGDFAVVTKSTEKIMSLSLSAAFKKESKYYDALSSNFGALRDTGHYLKWVSDVIGIETAKGSRWIKKTTRTTRENSVTNQDPNSAARGRSTERANARKVLELSKGATESTCKPFTMMNFTVAFACIILGSFIAGAGFLLEILSFKNRVFLKWHKKKYRR